MRWCGCATAIVEEKEKKEKVETKAETKGGPVLLSSLLALVVWEPVLTVCAMYL